MNNSRNPNDNSNFEEPTGYEYEYPREPTRPPTPSPRPSPQSPNLPPDPPERLIRRGAEYEPLVTPRAPNNPQRNTTRPNMPIPNAAQQNVSPTHMPPSYSRATPTHWETNEPSGGAGVWLMRLAFFLLGSLIFLVCGGLALAGGAYLFYANELPSADKLATVNTQQSTKIYDRNGGLLYEILDPNLGRHTIIPPEKIPLVLKQATLATEDPTFYTNPGVDWYGVARAIYYLVRYQRPVSGASTITQQLIKNTLLSPEQTVERKIKEAILALEVTRRYSKDQILAFYLNTINYGNHSYGIEAAAQSYFSKDVTQLDLAEASMLAGLPQLPAIYDPCLNPDMALERQNTVLGLMQDQGYISQAQAASAAHEMQQRVASEEFISKCRAGLNYTAAPHFVEYVRQELEAKYGPDVVNNGGLQVYTTLDPQVQSIVEDEARKQIAALKTKNVKSAAAVVANPQTGEIYAMLGSVDFNDPNIDGQVNVATRPRQPGSSIKLLTYLTAFEKGWTPATPIYDLVTDFPNGAQPPYRPTNYDNKEHGLIPVRLALANSYNIPAVKTLYFIGVPELMATAQRLGITTFTDPSRYGLALTLGGGEVKLVELTGAYATIANDGKRVPLTPFKKILDGTGRVMFDASNSDAVPAQVTDPRYAYLLTSILSDNNARTPAFGANSPLKVSRPAFVKTGTTNDYKDNWTLGGTTELVIGVWVGNPRGEAMQNVSGITGAAPIWHNVFERVYQQVDAFKGIAPHPFPIPAGLVQEEVCNESGLVPTENCPADHRHSEIFLTNQAPNQFDDVWVKLKVDKTNGQLANENCPAEIVEERVFAKLHPDPVLPYDKIQAWGAAHGYPVAPTENSPCTNNAPAPTVEQPIRAKINHPNEGDPVSGVVTVNGVARVPDGGAWVLEVGRAGAWTAIATGTADQRGQLGQFDANAFGEGELDIRLTAHDQYGRPTEDKVRVFVQPLVVPPPTQVPTIPPPTLLPPTLIIPTPIPPTPILPTPIPPTPEPPTVEPPSPTPLIPTTIVSETPTEAPTQPSATPPVNKSPTAAPTMTETTAP